METLKDFILAEHSKAQAIVIADIVLQKPELIEDLMTYSFANEEPLSRRASWPLRLLLEQNPNHLKNKIDTLIANLEKIECDAVLRNILAILANAEIPENKKSYLLNFTIQKILNPKSTIAVIAFASDVFAKIAGNEISLMKELLLVLEQIEPKNNGGIKVKIKQIRIKIKRLENATK